MFRRAFIIAILVSLLGAGSVGAQEPTGTIKGQLVNKTQGGGDVSGVTVTLKTYVSDKEKESKETKTDKEGRFQFTGLPMKQGYSYEATTTYQGADYVGDRLSFTAGEETKTLELPVYTATTSEEAIKINRAHLLVSSDADGKLQIEEYDIFINQGDKTYVGSKQVSLDGKKATLRFGLPSGVSDLQYILNLMDCCAVKAMEGVVDTMGIPPGPREMGMRYQVESSGGVYNLSWPVLYPTDGFELLVKGDAVKVASDQLIKGDILTLEGGQYQHYSARDLKPNTTMTASLAGLPVFSLQKGMIWGGVGLAILAGAFALSYPLLRRKPQPATVSIESRRRALLLDMARLDDDLEAGAISSENHQRQRQQKKAQILQLTRQAKGKGNGQGGG